jgi:hypothetical protein
VLIAIGSVALYLSWLVVIPLSHLVDAATDRR